MGISIKPLLNYRNAQNLHDAYSIHLRVTIDRIQRYYKIAVPQKVTPVQWSGEEDKWVRSNHPYCFEINQKIREKKLIVTDLVKRFYTQNKTITFYALDRELNKRGDRSLFNDYVRNYISHPPEHVQLDVVTWEKYNAFAKHLDAFQPKIKFTEIDETLIARFRNYLASLKGRNGKMNPATIKSYFDKFKVILMYAARKEHLLDVRDLESWLGEVKISIPRKKEGQHLEIGEIQKLRGLEFTPTDKSLERDRDLFLFQVYTGLYYNDLQILRKDQLFTDVELGYYIISERDKNDRPTIIPLYKFPYAKQIIERYRNTDLTNPLLFDAQYFIEVQAYNRNLKLLAKRAEILRTLSNKTGRHTNAQMWIRFGADRPVLSKMLGHEQEQTTQNYYKVNIREVIEGTKSVNFEQYGI